MGRVLGYELVSKRGILVAERIVHAMFDEFSNVITNERLFRRIEVTVDKTEGSQKEYHRAHLRIGRHRVLAKRQHAPEDTNVLESNAPKKRWGHGRFVACAAIASPNLRRWTSIILRTMLVAMRSVLPLALIAICASCGPPSLTKEGQIAFGSANGSHGAGVYTSNGLEFHEASEMPVRVRVRDPDDPWRIPLGFIVPKSKRFAKISTAVRIEDTTDTPCEFSFRSSDELVPSWGGEVFVAMTLLAKGRSPRPRDRSLW